MCDATPQNSDPYTAGPRCTHSEQIHSVLGGDKMQKAIGYIRVSTEGQAVDGVSLDAQKAKIEAWCVANDFELEGVFVDAGISGKRADNR